MILPLRVLGSSGTTWISRGRAIGEISLATSARSSSTMFYAPLCALRLEDDERADGLSGLLVGRADHGGLRHSGVPHQRGLDLGGRDAVPGDVHDIVDAAQHPDLAIAAVARAVTGEVPALLGETRPVGLLEPLRVTPDAAQHRRPRLVEHEVAVGLLAVVGAGSSWLPSSSTIMAEMPGSGVMAEPGLAAVTPGSGEIMIAPVSVCHQVSTIGVVSAPK